MLFCYLIIRKILRSMKIAKALRLGEETADGTDDSNTHRKHKVFFVGRWQHRPGIVRRFRVEIPSGSLTILRGVPAPGQDNPS